MTWLPLAGFVSAFRVFAIENSAVVGLLGLLPLAMLTLPVTVVICGSPGASSGASDSYDQ